MRIDGSPWVSGAGAAALALGGAGAALHAAGTWQPGQGAGLALGVLAATLLVCLAGYSLPKRLVARWMRRRRSGLRADAQALPRSRTRAHLIAHLAVGLLALGCALGHTGARAPSGAAGALLAAFWLTSALGGVGALAYRLLPGRLSRLERRGSLPEDRANERRSLDDRLYRETTGRSELVKTIATRILFPYARAALGPLALALSGRDLRAEERRLRGRIDAALAGRGGDRLAGLDDLVRTVVELRAGGARRALHAALRSWLPLHIVAAMVTIALLAVHIAREAP
jgi:hypothetical protein